MHYSEMPEDVKNFMQAMRDGGRQASSEELFRLMRGFKDNVTLDHLYRDQLVAIGEPATGPKHVNVHSQLSDHLRVREFAHPSI